MDRFEEMLKNIDAIKLWAYGAETSVKDHRANVMRKAEELRLAIVSWETLHNLDVARKG